MITKAALLLFFVFGTTCFYFGIVSLAYYPLALYYPFWERRLFRRARAERYTPSVSVLIPAYNEEKTIAISLRSVLSSDYPNFEVIVINDGSTDGTERELEAFRNDPRLRYISKPNGGKAAALNLGLAEASGEIILFTDADSLFEPLTIRNGVTYFIDPSVGAVSGNDTVLAPKGPLQKMLLITSHIGTGFVRRALSCVGVLQIISGNLGLVRTEILRRIGGFREVWGEDLEVTIRLKRHGVRVVYGASTRVLAECPHTVSALWKQRVRWLRSYIKILRMHHDMVANPRYGLFGPFLAFNFFNMILIPVLQVLALVLLPLAWWQGRFGLHGLGWVSYLGFGFLLLAAIVAILLDKTPRDLLRLPYAVQLVFFSYFYNLVVLYSIWAEARARDETWFKLERRGVDAPPDTARKERRFFLAALIAGAWSALVARHSRWIPEAEAAQTTPGADAGLVAQPGTTAVAIHFDAFTDWRDAYRRLLDVPEARYVNRVAVSAGRADWTYFRWAGNEAWWSREQSAADVDMLEDTLTALQQRGYLTTAILDVYGERYLQRFPAAAARDIHGHPSKLVICSTELAYGAAGDHLAAAAEALASTTRADTVSLTELFYEKHCYDARCLASFRKATGRADWPRLRDGTIDTQAHSIGAWRSRQVETIVARLAQIAHGHGKGFALDVKVSNSNLMRNSIENGQDYDLLSPHIDAFVAWDYFALAGQPPEQTARVAAYFDDEFGADKFYLSIGLWAPDGTISADQLARSLQAAREGGAKNLWITPAEKMSPHHWRVLAAAVRAGLRSRDPGASGR